jgi:hypothetical protein
MRSNPYIPLVPSEANPAKLIKKGKASLKKIFDVVTSASSQLSDSSHHTPVVLSSKISLPSAEVSKKLDSEEFPFEYSPS